MATVEQRQKHATSQGGAVPSVLCELFENPNYLNIMSYAISTEISVSFKVRKIYNCKLRSLLNFEGKRSD